MDPLASIVAEARAAVAAGLELDADALAARVRDAAPDDAARDRTLAQLERVVAVHRARRLVARPQAAPPQKPAERGGLRRSALRTRASITANMDIRATARDGGVALAWDEARGVTAWEVRISERADARSDYEVRETRQLPAETTAVEVALSERPLRVHVLGRGRDGRLLRRAVISALTAENWNDRWQKRASAS